MFILILILVALILSPILTSQISIYRSKQGKTLEHIPFFFNHLTPSEKFSYILFKHSYPITNWPRGSRRMEAAGTVTAWAVNAGYINYASVPNEISYMRKLPEHKQILRLHITNSYKEDNTHPIYEVKGGNYVKKKFTKMNDCEKLLSFAWVESPTDYKLNKNLLCMRTNINKYCPKECDWKPGRYNIQFKPERSGFLIQSYEEWIHTYNYVPNAIDNPKKLYIELHNLLLNLYNNHIHVRGITINLSGISGSDEPLYFPNHSSDDAQRPVDTVTTEFLKNLYSNIHNYNSWEDIVLKDARNTLDSNKKVPLGQISWISLIKLPKPPKYGPGGTEIPKSYSGQLKKVMDKKSAKQISTDMRQIEYPTHNLKWAPLYSLLIIILPFLLFEYPNGSSDPKLDSLDKLIHYYNTNFPIETPFNEPITITTPSIPPNKWNVNHVSSFSSYRKSEGCDKMLSTYKASSINPTFIIVNSPTSPGISQYMIEEFNDFAWVNSIDTQKINKIIEQIKNIHIKYTTITQNQQSHPSVLTGLDLIPHIKFVAYFMKQG